MTSPPAPHLFVVGADGSSAPLTAPAGSRSRTSTGVALRLAVPMLMAAAVTPWVSDAATTSVSIAIAVVVGLVAAGWAWASFRPRAVGRAATRSASLLSAGGGALADRKSVV